MRLKSLGYGLVVIGGLAGCANAAVISRIEHRNTYKPEQVSSTVKQGTLPGAIFGQPVAGATAEQVAAALKLPGWLNAERVGSGTPLGYRLVLVFNPVAPVEADTLCSTPETVAIMPAGRGDLQVQGAWCFWDRAASRAFSTSALPTSLQDPAFTSAMGQLMSALLPATAFPPDPGLKSDFFP